MRKVLGSALLIAASLVCSTARAASLDSCKSAELASASDVTYPFASVGEGVVVLAVSVDRTGGVTGTRALRDIPSLTSSAIAAARSWKFKPALGQGGPTASAMTMAFVFRPGVTMAAPPSFEATLPGKSGCTPAGILEVAYPEYPINSVVSGTVVIQVTVQESGKAGSIEVIRGIVPLTAQALIAARKWKFQAASLNGKPVASKAPIAFVFRLPTSR